MPRTDFLALSFDDLAALTNRGTAKRAQKEVEAGEHQCTWTETDAGEVTAAWSDAATCIFPAGKTVHHARCTCVATTICRHVVRSIFAYQRVQQDSPPAADPTTDSAAAPERSAEPQSWDPGAVTDEQLAGLFSRAVLSAAKARLEQGLLIELVRGVKPIASFQQLGCTLRFQVPYDVRYALCDCADPSPCGHVPLAVWAFRKLPPNAPAGLVSTETNEAPMPADVLDAVEQALLELAEEGIAHLPRVWRDRLTRLIQQCESAGLVWPAEVLSEIATAFDRYAERDARFDPERLVELVGESLIRSDAIRSHTGEVPQTLIRGSADDRAVNIGSARYIGLGCDVRAHKGTVEINAYLQHADSGTIAAVGRDFTDPKADDPTPPKEFWQLAQTVIFRETSVAAVGAGQLLLQGARRGADHRLVIGRSKASVNPQAFAWETLRRPTLVEDLAELRDRLSLLPPASLRPRYVAADLHVCPVAGVDAAQFNHATQTFEAQVRDARDNVAFIRFPYVARAGAGVDAILRHLGDASQRLCFVAGRARMTTGGLEIAPLTLVFEKEGKRIGIQPWVHRPEAQSSTTAGNTAPPSPVDRIADFPQRLLSRVGELFTVGLRNCDGRFVIGWKALCFEGQSVGFDRLPGLMQSLATELDRKSASLQWQARPAAGVALHLAELLKLAGDLADTAPPT